jgi:hypothetical protein
MDGIDGALLGRDIETSQPTLQAFDTILGGGFDLNFNGIAATVISTGAGQQYAGVTNIGAVNLDDGVANVATIVDAGAFIGGNGVINGGDLTNNYIIASADATAMLGAAETFTINSAAGSTDVTQIINVTAGDDLSTITVNGAATGYQIVEITGNTGIDLSAQAVFGGAGALTEVNIGANVNELVVNNSGLAMATVDLSANVAPIVTINNDLNVTFAGAGFAANLTELHVDVSAATVGVSVDFSLEAGNLLPAMTTVTLGANNGFVDNVNVTATSMLADITNVVTIHNFEAGAGLDTVTVFNGGLTVYTVNLNATTAGTFIGDLNAAIATQAPLYTDLAGDIVLANVTGSGALDGLYGISDTTAGGFLDGTAEVVEFVDIVGTLAPVNFV